MHQGLNITRWGGGGGKTERRGQLNSARQCAIQGGLGLKSVRGGGGGGGVNALKETL